MTDVLPQASAEAIRAAHDAEQTLQKANARAGAPQHAAGANADTPILLVGYRSGVQTVFRILASNLTATVSGVAVFDGDYPAPALDVWARFGALSRAGKAPRLTVDVQGLEPASVEALSAALGRVPEAPEGQEARDGSAPPEAPETEPARVGRLLALHYGPESATMPEPAHPEHVEATPAEVSVPVRKGAKAPK